MASDTPKDVNDLMGEIVHEIHKDALRKRQSDKDKWIALARAEFQAATKKREACCICGRYAAITEAHHTVPLSHQFDRAFPEADHRHVWLCPNHHAIIHRLLGPTDLNATGELIPLLEGSTQDERERLQKLLVWASEGPRA